MINKLKVLFLVSAIVILAEIFPASSALNPFGFDDELVADTVTMPLAKYHSKFLGNIIGNEIHSNYDTYWNQITPENGGKWGSVESTKNVMNWSACDRVYNHAKSKGYKFRYHTLVWGNQEPAWITSLSQADQKTEMEDFMKAVANRYPKIDYIDVVNEPLSNPSNIREALGGSGVTGWDWVVWSFRKARELFPNAKLCINDYGIIGSTTKAEKYVGLINILKKENLIDGIGIQCHQFNVNTVSVSTMKTVLNLLASTGLPIYVTELDIDGQGTTDPEEQQYLRYKEKFPILWEHENVVGITLWGYITGKTWKTGTGIVEANGTERKAMVWLKSYMASSASIVPNKFNILSNVDNTKLEEIKIFPNPVDNFITITGLEAKKIELYDVSGEKQILFTLTNRIDVSNLPKGIYFLKITSENQTVIKKFIRK